MTELTLKSKALLASGSQKEPTCLSFRMHDFAVEELHDEMKLGSQQPA